MKTNVKQSIISLLIKKIKEIEINDLTTKDIYDEVDNFKNYKNSTLNHLLELQEKKISNLNTRSFADELLNNVILDDLPFTEEEQEQIVSLFNLSDIEKVEFTNELKRFNNGFNHLCEYDRSRNVNQFILLLIKYLEEKARI